MSDTELEALNEYIDETYDFYDVLWDNCAHFAVHAWNIASNDNDLPERALPSKVKEDIEETFSDYESNLVLTTPSFYGYYNGTDFVSFVGG